jgi:energy-coupling factor transport system permease protein
MKIDPRTKIFIIVCLTSLSVFSKDIVYLGVVVGISIIIDILLKINILDAIKKLKHLFTLIIFIALMQSIFVKGGTAILHINDFVIISSIGLINAAEFALRMSIIIFASMIALTTNSSEMIDGLIKLKLPYELAFMTNITLRFIPIFRDEFQTRITAIAMRGIDIKELNLRKKLKLYTYLLAPTLSGTIIKSKYLAKSIETRAFRAYKEKTMLRELKLKFIDYFVIIVMLIFVIIFLYFMINKGAIL